MTARDPVYAALALEPRVACPFEVGGVRMNLAQLRHTLAGAGWQDPDQCRVLMSENVIHVTDGASHTVWARFVRADGVSEVMIPALTSWAVHKNCRCVLVPITREETAR